MSVGISEPTAFYLGNLRRSYGHYRSCRCHSLDNHCRAVIRWTVTIYAVYNYHILKNYISFILVPFYITKSKWGFVLNTDSGVAMAVSDFRSNAIDIAVTSSLLIGQSTITWLAAHAPITPSGPTCFGVKWMNLEFRFWLLGNTIPGTLYRDTQSTFFFGHKLNPNYLCLL